MSDHFEVVAGGLISSPSSVYEVQGLLGNGTFGDVAQCRKVATNETVALKVLKDRVSMEDAEEEEEILELMKLLSSADFNIVKWNCSFVFEGRYCIEFEKLDISLLDFLQMRGSLELKEIRPIVQQLATALDFLDGAGIIHADLKPDNIMLVDHVRQPLKVKVIDFGLAFSDPEEFTGSVIQTLWYRAPEVLLGTPLSEAIDVWSLGCIAAEMLMGSTLFRSFGEYDAMRHINHIIGKPPSHLLDAGLHTKNYFRATGMGASEWRFMTPLEARIFTLPRTFSSLSDLLKISNNLSGEDAKALECDRASFVDMVQGMLMVDSAERITPTQMLQHPFITMSHLSGSFNDSLHVESCKELMSQSAEKDEDDDQEAAWSSAVLMSTAFFPEKTSAKKRKRHGADSSKCGHRSPDITSSSKKRRRQTKAGEKSCPQSQLKRKRDEAELCFSSQGSSSAKKRKTETDGLQKLLNNSVEDPSNKRKRDNEESSQPKRRRDN